MSHCAIRMCSSRCQKVYGTFRGLTLMSLLGNPLRASASERCASPSRKLTSRLRRASSVCMRAVYPRSGAFDGGGGGPAERGAKPVQARADLVPPLAASDRPLELVAHAEYFVGRGPARAEDQGPVRVRERAREDFRRVERM